jgi:hypothetical protein
LVSSLSLPLDGGPDVRGALNLYAGEPKAFTAELQHQAQALAAEACRALRLAVRLTNQVQLTHNLETAMASRSVIDQALGIIMGQNRCAAADAFDILRRASNRGGGEDSVVATGHQATSALCASGSRRSM